MDDCEHVEPHAESLGLSHYDCNDEEEEDKI